MLSNKHILQGVSTAAYSASPAEACYYGSMDVTSVYTETNAPDFRFQRNSRIDCGKTASRRPAPLPRCEITDFFVEYLLKSQKITYFALCFVAPL